MKSTVWSLATIAGSALAHDNFHLRGYGQAARPHGGQWKAPVAVKSSLAGPPYGLSNSTLSGPTATGNYGTGQYSYQPETATSVGDAASTPGAYLPWSAEPATSVYTTVYTKTYTVVEELTSSKTVFTSVHEVTSTATETITYTQVAAPGPYPTEGTPAVGPGPPVQPAGMSSFDAPQYYPGTPDATIVYTAIYTTTLPVEAVHTEGPETVTKTLEQTSLVTKYITSTLYAEPSMGSPAAPGSPSSKASGESPSAPAYGQHDQASSVAPAVTKPVAAPGYGQNSVSSSDVAAPSEYSSAPAAEQNGEASTSSTVYYGTIPLTHETSAPASSSDTESSQSQPAYYGTIPLTYATPSADASSSAATDAIQSPPASYGSIPLTYATPSPDGSGAEMTQTVSEIVTTYTSIYTTKVPETTFYPINNATATFNGTRSAAASTFTSQSVVTTIITSTITATVNIPVSSTAAAANGTSSLLPPYPYGSQSASIPGFSSGGFSMPVGTGSRSASVVPVGTGSSSSIMTSATSSVIVSSSTTVNYPANNATVSSGPLGSGTAPIISSTKSRSFTIPAANATTSSAFGSGTRPVTTSSSSTSVVYPAGNSTTSAFGSGTAPVTASSSSTSVAFPAGNSTTSAPVGSTGAPIRPSSTSYALNTTSSTTSSCTSKPTQTDFCIPCDGQPGKDPANHCGYTVHDDSYQVMPKTCRTVEYNFEVTSMTIAPDGIPRLGQLVNGQMPGPAIEANWGDTIIVHLSNKMPLNGTSIHFHGIRQNYTNEMDGVPSITQCALAPGEKMTYTFKASNYGTSWYHSHFALQAYEGVFGPMIIHGPHSQEFDIDSGMITLQDWSHVTVDSMYDAAQTVGPSPQNGPRVLDTGLINGMNVWGSGDNQTGQRYEMNFVPGKVHLLRLVNTAIQSTFKFHIDGHKFTVISADFVPIVPYETDILAINIGQRYNILVHADQIPGDYWMRSDNQQACAQLTNARDIKGMVHYIGHHGMPTSTAKNYTDSCIDEPYESLVPVVSLNAGHQDKQVKETVVIGPGPNTPNLFKWTLSGTTFQSQWGDPTLFDVYNNGTIPPYSGSLAIEVPRLKEWVYIIVESPIPLPHPIHLHGHDFLVLAQGTGLYDEATTVLKTDNPPRRDVAMMPWDGAKGLGGHLVLAFETDNPGAWLMHCHIGWHVSMGFALQIVENLEGIPATVTDSCQLNDTCYSWNKYAKANGINNDYDSGV